MSVATVARQVGEMRDDEDTPELKGKSNREIAQAILRYARG